RRCASVQARLRTDHDADLQRPGRAELVLSYQVEDVAAVACRFAADEARLRIEFQASRQDAASDAEGALAVTALGDAVRMVEPRDARDARHLRRQPELVGHAERDRVQRAPRE